MKVLTWDCLAKEDSDKRADGGVRESTEETALVLWVMIDRTGGATCLLVSALCLLLLLSLHPPGLVWQP